jgi:CubicO group peptidase (beta-lactamase class C family)
MMGNNLPWEILYCKYERKLASVQIVFRLTEDLDCTEPECLKYKADAGTQWFYHNAPYTLLDKVVTNATGKNYNLYFAEKIKALTGMNGAWFKLGFNMYISAQLVRWLDLVC